MTLVDSCARHNESQRWMAARSYEWPSAHSTGSSVTLVEIMTKRVPTKRSAPVSPNPSHCTSLSDCLLYTSDAADE